jgi:ABC-type polysaccharide/polyol phosphate export permease
VLLQTIYFISLVLIPVEAIPNATLQKLLLISPFACLVEQLRHAVISESAPTVLEVFGNPLLLALPVSLAIALCVIAFIVFDRMAPKVAEEL